jgi:hypothetical protein
MKFKFLFAWYDFWVGLFWDAKKCRLYIFPVPMLGCYLDFAKPLQRAQRPLVLPEEVNRCPHGTLVHHCPDCSHGPDFSMPPSGAQLNWAAVEENEKAQGTRHPGPRHPGPRDGTY